MRNCTTVQLSMVGAVPPTGERAADFHPLLAFGMVPQGVV